MQCTLADTHAHAPAAPRVDHEAGPTVRFIDTGTGDTLTQRQFLALFVPHLGADVDDVADPVPTRVPSSRKKAVFHDDAPDLAQARKRWAGAVAAAGAFRQAVNECSANHAGSVYWKSAGFRSDTLDTPFAALCCPTVAPLSSVGDGTKFEVNRDALHSEKMEYTQVHPVRMMDVRGTGGLLRIPGTHGFTLFASPSSTLIVPGRTRKHRCSAPIPAHGVWGGLRNVDAMAHLAPALQARNARVLPEAEGGSARADELVRDAAAQYLVTDEELAFGLRLVALEILRQLATVERHEAARDALDHETVGPSTATTPPTVVDKEFIWWFTHGHDIPWVHFKVMSSAAILKKRGKGVLKEQYTAAHLRLLGFTPSCQPLPPDPA
jgi:hypothetical protein